MSGFHIANIPLFTHPQPMDRNISKEMINHSRLEWLKTLLYTLQVKIQNLKLGMSHIL